MKRRPSWFEIKKYTDAATGELELPSVLVSKFDPENQLEQLLIDAGYDANARPTFERCFLGHEVFVAIRDDGQAEGLHESIGDLVLNSLQSDDGEYFPVGFTSQNRGYDCFGPETVMAKMTGRQLVEMVLEAGVWLNPSSGFGVLWKPEDLNRILSL